MTNDSMENIIKGEKARVRGSQLQLATKPQGIKVETSYKPNNKVDSANLSDNQDKATKSKSNKPVYLMSKIDPMSSAFPERDSLGMSLSVFNSSLMPVGSGPITTNVVK